MEEEFLPPPVVSAWCGAEHGLDVVWWKSASTALRGSGSHWEERASEGHALPSPLPLRPACRPEQASDSKK